MPGARKTVPVTMLSGFLGAGKTTILRELLSHTNHKIGCIVNDVAAVNIDAKLVRNQLTSADPKSTTSDLAPTIELQNGCACCSIQEELFMSFEQMLMVSDRNNSTFDRIVLENSGVAEPQNIRDAFSDAEEMGHPVLDRIHLSTLITVVDSHTFIKEYACRNPVATREDLGGDMSAMPRPVVDLLVEQIEVADYVVLNKVDMLGSEKVPELEAIIKAINPLCTVVTCSHGKVDIEQLFGANSQSLLARLNTEGQHRGYIAASKHAEKQQINGKHSRDNQESHADECRDHEHKDDHDHRQHKHAKHEHSDHEDKHEHEGTCNHDHASGEHGHKHEHGKQCDHDHHHDETCGHHHAPGEKHNHNHGKTTAETRFGITSFVYSRRKPFHPQRLKDIVLRWMPVTHNAAVDEAGLSTSASPMRTVMRSKGFTWMAHSHVNAFYWSHAGQHFELREEGDWWAAVPDAEWPEHPDQRGIILSDFEAGFGDRRQEIVFIGAGMDQAAIECALDKCLLTEEEVGTYVANWARIPDPEHPGAPCSTAVGA